MSTNAKLGIILATSQHVATTHMVLTHVNVATAGVETGLPAKVKRKHTCISIVVSATCANYFDMFLALGEKWIIALSEGTGKCFKSLKTRSIMRRYRERKTELIPKLARQLAVVCPILLVQKLGPNTESKAIAPWPRSPPETKTACSYYSM